MANKVHGFNHGSKQNLTGGLDFFTVYTTVNITPTGARKYTQGTIKTNYIDSLDLADADTKAQHNLDKLIEVISTRGQPVFISGVTSSTESVPETVADFKPVSKTTVYTLQFAIEHNFAWDVSPSTIPSLSETLNGVGDFVYTGKTGASSNTISVVKNASYSNDFNVNISKPTV